MNLYLCLPRSQKFGYFRKGQALSVDAACNECDVDLEGREAYGYQLKVYAECYDCGKKSFYARSDIGDKVECRKCGVLGQLSDDGKILEI